MRKSISSISALDRSTLEVILQPRGTAANQRNRRSKLITLQNSLPIGKHADQQQLEANQRDHQRTNDLWVVGVWECGSIVHVGSGPAASSIRQYGGRWSDVPVISSMKGKERERERGYR